MRMMTRSMITLLAITITGSLLLTGCNPQKPYEGNYREASELVFSVGDRVVDTSLPIAEIAQEDGQPDNHQLMMALTALQTAPDGTITRYEQEWIGLLLQNFRDDQSLAELSSAFIQMDSVYGDEIAGERDIRYFGTDRNHLDNSGGSNGNPDAKPEFNDFTRGFIALLGIMGLSGIIAEVGDIDLHLHDSHHWCGYPYPYNWRFGYPYPYACGPWWGYHKDGYAQPTLPFENGQLGGAIALTPNMDLAKITYGYQLPDGTAVRKTLFIVLDNDGDGIPNAEDPDRDNPNAGCDSIQITEQPIGGTLPATGNFELSVEATGDNLTYEWLRGTEVVGNGPILLVNEPGTYRVIVSDGCGEELSSATVTVSPTPNTCENVIGDINVVATATELYIDIDNHYNSCADFLYNLLPGQEPEDQVVLVCPDGGGNCRPVFGTYTRGNLRINLKPALGLDRAACIYVGVRDTDNFNSADPTGNGVIYWKLQNFRTRLNGQLMDFTSEGAICVDIPSASDTTPPTITLIGNSQITVQCGGSYVDSGATATDDRDGDITDNVTVTGTFNLSDPGIYTLTYHVSDAAGNQSPQLTRTITVIDSNNPVITLNGQSTVTVPEDGAFNDPGATAMDMCDGNINVVQSGTVNTGVPGTYTRTYTATDSSGNTATATRSVIVQQSACAQTVITLLGENPMQFTVGQQFVEPGFTAVDPRDGVVTSQVIVTGTVNTNAVGNYERLYSFTNSCGTTTSVVRTIVVGPVTCVPVGNVNISGGGVIQPGGSATLTATVTGTGPYTYQWRRNGINIANATSATYVATEAGSYSVHVSNDCNTTGAVSGVTEVTIGNPPSPVGWYVTGTGAGMTARLVVGDYDSPADIVATNYNVPANTPWSAVRQIRLTFWKVPAPVWCLHQLSNGFNLDASHGYSMPVTDDGVDCASTAATLPASTTIVEAIPYLVIDGFPDPIPLNTGLIKGYQNGTQLARSDDNYLLDVSSL